MNLEFLSRTSISYGSLYNLVLLFQYNFVCVLPKEYYAVKSSKYSFFPFHKIEQILHFVYYWAKVGPAWVGIIAHFSKRPSDLKLNGTQEKTPFSGTVFHTLSHDVVHFVASGSFKSH